ncbi:MAG TPA: CpsD/CapB family tyrosine-protein kinase [Vicinamibacterales bacterium]|jgi:capsular exopolysaccharide synthesis family protein
MGRIDEALRRSGQATRAAENVAVEDDAFVSPWSFREPATVTAMPERERVEPVRLEPARAEPARPAVRIDAQPLDTLRTAKRFNERWIERLVISKNADSLLVEQFRLLAATLHQMQATNNTRVIMVTSAEAAEGKSMTAINLSLTLSESYRRRVLLIDADLRRPSLHEITGVPNTFGLGETLKSETEQKVPAFQLSDTLTVVPAGQPDRNPMSALTSPRMEQILSDAAAAFDWVVVDAPPVAPVVDSSLLTPFLDGVLLVVRAGTTHYATVQRAIESIGRERILGVVLNGADADAGGYRRYYEAYETKPGSDTE